MPAEEARRLLDEALVCLAKAPPPLRPLEGVADATARALASLGEWEARQSDFHAARAAWEDARGFAAQAARLLEQHPPLPMAPARVALAGALEHLAQPGPSSMQAPARLQAAGDWLAASVGEPRVLAFERPILVPRVPLPPVRETTPEEAPPPASEEEAPALTLEALKDLMQVPAQESTDESPPAAPTPVPAQEPSWATVEDAEREHFGVALTEAEVIEERTRSCMEDLAAFSSMRRPEGQPSQSGQATVERRLLARMDCLVSFGTEALTPLVQLLEERPLPDPDLTWAHLFLFGSLAGKDSLAQVLRLARVTELEDAEMVEAVADALALAPHPELTEAVRPWLKDEAPGRRVVALRALARRGGLTAAEVERAARDPDLGVVRTGAQVLGLSLGPLAPGVLQQLAVHADEEVVRGALFSGLQKDRARSLHQARALCESGRGAFGDAALIVALAGGQDDVDLLAHTSASGNPITLVALGWFGSLTAVPSLLSWLGKAGPHQESAVEALQRLLGASLTDEDPAPAYPTGFPEEEVLLSLDARAWGAWWEANHQKMRPVRHRFGQEWSLEHNLWEMGTARPLRCVDRRRAFGELLARTGAPLVWTWDAFEAVRRRQMVTLRERVAGGRWATSRGHWTA